MKMVRDCPVFLSTRMLSPLCIDSQCAASAPLRPPAYRSNDPIQPASSSDASKSPRGFARRSGAKASTVVSLTVIALGLSPLVLSRKITVGRFSAKSVGGRVLVDVPDDRDNGAETTENHVDRAGDVNANTVSADILIPVTAPVEDEEHTDISPCEWKARGIDVPEAESTDDAEKAENAVEPEAEPHPGRAMDERATSVRWPPHWMRSIGFVCCAIKKLPLQKRTPIVHGGRWSARNGGYDKWHGSRRRLS